MICSVVRPKINSVKDWTGSNQTELNLLTKCITGKQGSHGLNPNKNPPLLNSEKGTSIGLNPELVCHMDKLSRIRPVYTLVAWEAMCKSENCVGNPY